MQIVSIERAPLTLEGRLELPEEAPGPVPVAILLHPWGAWDLDGSLDAEMSADGRPIHLFRQLRDALLPAGFGVLRYNSRFAGVNGPGDERFPMLTFTGMVEDAQAAVALLRERPGIDPDRIWLIGISLGTEVAMAVAESDSRIGGLALLAPLGESYSRRSYYLQVERKLNWLWCSGLVDSEGSVDLAAVAARVAERTGWWELEPELASTERMPYEELAAVLKAHHAELVARLATSGDAEAPAVWWREWLDAPAPAERLRRFTGPTLLMVGLDDNTTPPRETHLLLRSTGQRETLKVRFFPEMGHLFSYRRADGSRTYGPLAPIALKAVTAFLRSH